MPQRVAWAIHPENRKEAGIIPLLGVDENTVMMPTGTKLAAVAS